MSIKSKHNIIWYNFIASRNEYAEGLLSMLKKNEFEPVSFENATDVSLGIIFVHGNQQYEQLVSFINFRIKSRGDRVIIINTSSEVFSNNDVIKTLHYGAEYFFESSQTSQLTETIIAKLGRWRNIESVLHSSIIKKHIAGESKPLKKMLRSVIEVAMYSEASVLILGERGTGKELIARIIHELQTSKIKGELVLVDCTTIKSELSGSEFFGHEKGSYTGAEKTREGAFALANNGTLFLDEVGELPLILQAELLRIIQEKTYKKIGSNIWRQTNFRLVCATNRNLEKECDEGNFRKDFYDRISLWKCYMPSLEERREDIPLLAEFFLKRNFPGEIPAIDGAVTNYLNQRAYSGNIRELQNVIKRICLRYSGTGPITLGDIPDYDRVINTESLQGNWHEKNELASLIEEALAQGYDAKNIVDTIKSLTTKIAINLAGNNRDVSQMLGKSERWVQLQMAKEK